MFIICKAVRNNNYALGLSETLVQLKVLPQKLAHSLKWNRFANTAGKFNSNIPIDLLMEHENKYFKQQLATYRGEYTQATVDRISKSQTIVNNVISEFDTTVDVRKRVGRGTKNVSDEDIERLVKVYRKANLLKRCPGRQHSTGLVFLRRNLMSSETANEVETWLTNSLFDSLRGAHYYEQFEGRVLGSVDITLTQLTEELDKSFGDLSFAD